MKNAKKIMALVLAMSLGLTVVGCRKGNTTSKGSQYEEYWSYYDDEDTDNGDNQQGTDNSNSSSNSSKTDNKTNNNTSTSGKGDSLDFGNTASAQQKWINLFGKDYVDARNNYEKDHAPYNVPNELKGKTVKFATWIDHTTTEAKYTLQNFEKTTGIKFQWVQVPQGEYLKKITAMVAANEAPDVILENNDSMPQLLQLSQPLNNIKSIDMNDPIWDKGYFNFTKFNGNIYQCNARNSVWQTGDLIFYNKKALKENGITTPQDYIDAGKWTFENCLNVMKEFKALNTSYNGGVVDASYLALANGVEYMYMKNGQFVSGINEPAFTSAMKAFYELKDQNLYGGNYAGLMKGTVGVVAVDSYGLKKTGYFKGIDSSLLGFAPIPSTSGTQYYASHYRAYGVCKSAKNPEGAGYFLRYFLDPYNYNWDDIFMNNDAKKAYLKYCADVDFDKKAFGFSTSGTIGVLGATDWEDIHKWETSINRGQSGQLNTTLNTLAPTIDHCVKESNAILQGLK